MKVTFLGTRGYIDAATPRHRMHTAALVEYRGTRVMIDCGATWLGKLDAGSLKIKVAASIVAISSIHLLKAFMNHESVTTEKMVLLIGTHLTFVVSALLLAVMDRIIPQHR